MREPHYRCVSDGVPEMIPLSQAPDNHLKEFASGDAGVAVPGYEFFDPDFRRRYAAILLKERGQ